MTSRERAAILRVVIICAAWALGEALTWQLRASGLALFVPALLAAAAYMATRDSGSRGGGGDGTYWRGQRIDRDRWH
jgi:type IV secretory pathway VirB2 component (pilin)